MRRRRRGFTLVEMLVALTLLGIGVVAWLGTTTLAVRMAGAATRETAAHYRSRSRAQQLAGSPCSAVVAGASPTEWWTVAAMANGIRLVRVVAPYADERGERLAVYELVIAC